MSVTSAANKAKIPYTHKQAIEDGTNKPRPYTQMVIDYYFVTKGNTLRDDLNEHFETEEEAKARAEALNDVADLTPPTA